jgi:hypothetical protein
MSLNEYKYLIDPVFLEENFAYFKHIFKDINASFELTQIFFPVNYFYCKVYIGYKVFCMRLLSDNSINIECVDTLIIPPSINGTTPKEYFDIIHLYPSFKRADTMLDSDGYIKKYENFIINKDEFIKNYEDTNKIETNTVDNNIEDKYKTYIREHIEQIIKTNNITDDEKKEIYKKYLKKHVIDSFSKIIIYKVNMIKENPGNYTCKKPTLGGKRKSKKNQKTKTNKISRRRRNARKTHRRKYKRSG